MAKGVKRKYCSFLLPRRGWIKEQRSLVELPSGLGLNYLQNKRREEECISKQEGRDQRGGLTKSNFRFKPKNNDSRKFKTVLWTCLSTNI